MAIAAESRALAHLVSPASGIVAIPLPASPTRSTREVMQAIAELRPDVVIFDSTARTQQLRAASRIGARVVYLSSRPSARARGFKLGALRWIDEHWSVELAEGRSVLSVWQRCLLHWKRGLVWRPLSTLFESPSALAWQPQLAAFVAGGDFVLACPGGGGGQLDGNSAAQVYANAALQLSSAGIRMVLVRADWPDGRLDCQDRCLQVGALPNAQLMALVGAARVCLLGAGSVLPQALAMGAPCVAAALMPDQRPRLSLLANAGAVLAATPVTESLADQARVLWSDESARHTLQQQAQRLGLRNGLDEALAALSSSKPAP